MRRMKQERIAELIVAALQIEVTIKQQGASRIVVHARCLAEATTCCYERRHDCSRESWLR